MMENSTIGWISLRKGGTQLHIAYGNTYSNNLCGHNLRVRTKPSLELSLDLNPNLRTRNKSENSCVDARELADGGIEGLRSVQLFDEYSLRRLGRLLRRVRKVPSDWTLIIELEGCHVFVVRPRHAPAANSLFLDVVAEE